MSKKFNIKRFSIFLLCAVFALHSVCAQEQDEEQENQIEQDDGYEGDEYDGDSPDSYEDDYVYRQNGPGDQFLNLRIMPNFPLNFGDKIKIGGQITVGYSRFLTSWFALGAELAFGYNPTIGSNILTYIPITLSATFLPNIKKFEFPITVNVGMAVENYLSYTYFPGLIVRGGAGMYYRINENWSVGLEGFFTYMPQWYVSKPEANDYYNMASVSAGVKYHF